jgi:hypothetical protein
MKRVEDADLSEAQLREEMRKHSLIYERMEPGLEVAQVQNPAKSRDKSNGRKPSETSTLQEDTIMNTETTTQGPSIHVRETNGALSPEQQAVEHVRKLEHHVSTIHKQLMEAHSMKREGIKLAVYASATAAITIGGTVFVQWLMKPSPVKIPVIPGK